MKQTAMGVLRYLGGGMWKVLPDCPAIQHNTLTAARGRISLSSRSQFGFARCVCPRALSMLHADKNARTARQPVGGGQGRARASQAGAVTGTRALVSGRGRHAPASYVSNVRDAVQPPDASLFRDAACASPGGIKLMDAGANARPGSAASRAALGLCAVCPLAVKQVCGEWAREAEYPAGSWDGIYGGMTQFDRRRAAGLPTSKG